MTAYLRPALRQTRFFSRSGLTRHLGLLYRTVQPTIVLFLLVLALTARTGRCLRRNTGPIPRSLRPKTHGARPRRRGGPSLHGRNARRHSDHPVRPARQRGVAYLLLHVVPDLPETNAADANPNRFADRKFRFLPINRGETQQTVQEFCRELGIAFSVGLDPDMSIYSLYATRYVPRNFIISPNGKILLSETDYDATIQRLLIEQIEQALQTTE